MNKNYIEASDYAKEIIQAIPKGVLVTTKAGEKVNTMTIGWGSYGVEWSKEMFTLYIREGRFTREQLDKNGEFTVNIPYGTYDKQIVGLCGSNSGRNMDKIKEAGLTLVDADEVSAPAIKELPLTLECKVVCRQKQELNLIDDKFQNFYPQDVDSTHCGANKDAHIAYYGEIVKAYIIED